MNQLISFKRLGLAWAALWYDNKSVIYTIPVIVLTLLLAVNLWPGSILYLELTNAAEKTDVEKWYQHIQDYRYSTRTVILLVIPCYIILCTRKSLIGLRSSINVLITPIKVVERLIVLYLFSFLIVVLVLISFNLFDAIFVEWNKKLFSSGFDAFLEAKGLLYHKPVPLLFSTLDNKIIVAVLWVLLPILPIYFLSYFIFGKAGPYFLLVASVVIIFWGPMRAVQQGRQDDVIRISLNGELINQIHIIGMLVFVACLLLGLYYRLKEREI